jgi:hypothetical protein
VKPLEADAGEIARTLRVLFQAGDVVEMRVPKTEHEGTVSGYFDNFAALAKALARPNGQYPALYVTLNRVNRSLLARAANRIRRHAKTATTDKDIDCRRWLLIDNDAVRPAGISSTEAEHDSALERARQIRFELAEEGWPAPILADSGNGGHLLYRIDLPNDEASTALVEGVLKALAGRYDDASVKIDQTVFNASRITKAYGTVVSKGDNISERPHRLSRIMDAPATLEPVERDLLEELVRSAAPPPQATPAPNTGAQPGRFDVEGFLARHLKAGPPVPYEGGRKWVLEECPFDPAHQGDAAVYQRPNGALGFRCFHNSCTGYSWRDVREKFEPRAERSRPERQQTAQSGGKPEPPRILSCAEVLKIETPAEELIFDGYPIPARGLTLLVGTPKSGKTLLAVQEALAIARHRPLFDYYSILKSGPVMIIEQDDPGGAASIKTILERNLVTSDTPLSVVPQLPFGLGLNLVDWLKQQITKLSLVFVVIDSYTAVRGPRTPGIDIVKQEQSELRQMDALAKEFECAIQLIHHASKGAAQLDWTQTAAGSFSVAGASEAQVHLSRFRDLDGGAAERLVRIQGRHSGDAYLVLRFRKDTLDFEWVMEGGAAEFYPVLRQIKSEVSETFAPKDLLQAIGISRATAHRIIARLRFAGALDKVGYGQYRLSARLKL